MKKYYLTTPIYYLNDSPHIGHAYTSIAADVVARFVRLGGGKVDSRGRGVHFLTGSDEHGQKVAQSAARANKPPLEFVNRMVKPFIALSEALALSNDDFIRTTEQRHIKAAQALWAKLAANDEIYLGSYKGWYSVRQETFLTAEQVTTAADGSKTAEDGEKLEFIEEPSYFFRLSKWQKPLLEHYRKHPQAVAPRSRQNEVVSFIKGGLKDLSISRHSLEWGVPVPNDPSHVMYVWVDALSNYLSAIDYPAAGIADYWPADLHIIGKDILRFHAVYWPALLLAAGLPPPKRIFAHGWWTNEGRKISKSLGNTIDPFAAAEAWGVDQLRYFLLAEVPFGNDGDWSQTALKNRINADLANGIGNLAMRTLALIHRHFNGSPPGLPESRDKTEKALLAAADGLMAKAEAHVLAQEFHLALAEIIGLVRAADGYLSVTQPWSAVKTDKARAGGYLAVVLRVLRRIAAVGEPFMPLTMPELKRLVTPTTVGIADGIADGTLPPPQKPLFPRIE